MVRLHGRWYTLIHLLYAHGLQPEAQVVRLRQVVRPRLLNDWTESLMQSARSQGGGFFMIGRCLLAQVTMKQVIN